MSTRLIPHRLDLRALAQSGEVLSGDEPIARFERLLADSVVRPQAPVAWQAQAEWRSALPVPGAEGLAPPQLWLHVSAEATQSLTCQRCLAPFELPLAVDRWFRFVKDEATADAEDEDSEEDLLVFEPAFDLLALLEDELIMAQPLVPMHDTCPTAVPLSAGDDEAPAAERPNPFAMLQQLKQPK